MKEKEQELLALVAKPADRLYGPSTREHEQLLIAALRERAPDEATSSRDFGRGYTHAVRVLEGLVGR